MSEQATGSYSSIDKYGWLMVGMRSPTQRILIYVCRIRWFRFVSLLIGQDGTPWVSRHEDWRYRWMDVGCWLLVASMLVVVGVVGLLGSQVRDKGRRKKQVGIGIKVYIYYKDKTGEQENDERFDQLCLCLSVSRLVCLSVYYLRQVYFQVYIDRLLLCYTLTVGVGVCWVGIWVRYRQKEKRVELYSFAQQRQRVCRDVIEQKHTTMQNTICTCRKLINRSPCTDR